MDILYFLAGLCIFLTIILLLLISIMILRKEETNSNSSKEDLKKIKRQVVDKSY